MCTLTTFANQMCIPIRDVCSLDNKIVRNVPLSGDELYTTNYKTQSRKVKFTAFKKPPYMVPSELKGNLRVK